MNLPNSGNSPTQGSGSQSRLPNGQNSGAGGRDSSTGDLNNGQSGDSGGLNGISRSASGDYSLDTLPGGGLNGSRGDNGDSNTSQAGGRQGQQSGGQQGRAPGQQGAGAMTTAERTAALDEALQRGYETFDGFILGERERAQRESNQAGSVDIVGQESSSGSGSANGGSNQPQILNNGTATRTGGVVAATQPVESGAAPAETFPPPEDIPSGRDDDVVARQIREAAMTEPDPELREALWEEYRNYTGISEDED